MRPGSSRVLITRWTVASGICTAERIGENLPRCAGKGTSLLVPVRSLFLARLQPPRFAFGFRTREREILMDLQLKDKVVLVTGGAKGIGGAIVRTATGEGAIPVIVDRDAEAGRKMQSEVPRSELIVGELSTPEFCQAAIEQTIRKCGRLDALINNAGVNDKIGLEHGSPAQFVESLGRNLLHYYNMAHFALPYLKKSRGNIVNVASKSDSGGQGRSSEYASVRGAILALTREWAAELAKYGIRVNAIIPAEAMTPSCPQPRNTLSEPEERLQ